MALTSEQINEVFGYTESNTETKTYHPGYSAFEKYSEEQKTSLREKLTSSGLEYLQIAVLFSDEASGGMIHNLVEDSQESDAAARQLGKIISNSNESINPAYGYPPTPIIQNMLGRIGPYNESIVADVQELTRQHVAIHGGRVIDPALPQQPGVVSEVGAMTPPTPAAAFAAIPSNLTSLDLGVGALSRRSDADELASAFRAIPSSVTSLNLGFFGGRAQTTNAQNRLVRQIIAESPGEDSARLSTLTDMLIANPEDLAARLERAQLLSTEHRNLAEFDYRQVLEREPQNQIALEGIENLPPPASPQPE